jgi:hypothetical protein
MLDRAGLRGGEYITLLTRHGRIKRVEAGAFANIRSSG